MSAPERSPERDAALDAALGLVPDSGWNLATMRRALALGGAEPLDAELLFPGGAADMIEAFLDLTDRRMVALAQAEGVAELRTSARVRALVALRLRLNRPHKEAVRRALAVLAMPRHAGLAARCLARTVDAIWYEAGDRSADFNWYTKRGLLAGIYAATALYWLRDDSDDDAPTLEFLDRRLAGIGALGRLRGRIDATLGRLRPGGQAA